MSFSVNTSTSIQMSAQAAKNTSFNSFLEENKEIITVITLIGIAILVACVIVRSSKNNNVLSNCKKGLSKKCKKSLKNVAKDLNEKALPLKSCFPNPFNLKCPSAVGKAVKFAVTPQHSL